MVRVCIEIKDGVISRIISTDKEIEFLVVDHDSNFIVEKNGTISFDPLVFGPPDYVTDKISNEFNYENNDSLYDLIRDEIIKTETI